MLAVTPFLVLASIAAAAPLVRRGPVIDNCYHDMAYTWDDGPYGWHDQINNAFSSIDSHTTFFLNGNNWDCIYDEANVQAIRNSYEAGHQIGHHTWAHADLQTLSYADIDVQINRLNDAFVRILGVKPKVLRPPYGSINDDIANYLLENHGLTTVTWSADSGDSDGTAEHSTADWNYNYYKNLADTWNGPQMGLSHETYEWSVDALLQGSATYMHNKGINLITVAQCINVDPYETVTGVYGTRDSSWTCDGPYVPMDSSSTSTTSSSTPVDSPTSTTSSSAPTQTCALRYSSTSSTTCQAVADLFGITADAVQAANSFVNCADIWSGTDLCIPSIGQTATPTSASTSTSTSPNTSTTPAPTCASTYTAVTGDTCTSIGSIYGLTAAEIQAANSFLNCADIWAWTPICIPPGGTTPPSSVFSTTTTTTTTSTTSSPQTCATTYTVPSATTCDVVASTFGITAAAVQAANSFVNCSDIWQGTSLCIPSIGTPTSTTSSTAPAATCASTYTAGVGDTCTTIGAKYGLTADQIQAANTFLNCSDIWQYTPICIPPGAASATCTQYISSQAGDTCDSIGAAHGVSGSQISTWNSFLTCSDIWANTQVCVKH